MKKLFIAACFIAISTAAADCYEPPASIFGQNNNFSPGGGTTNSTTTYTLGVKFTTNTAGTITKLSFFKTSLDTVTTRNLILWSSTGTNLVQCTTTNEPTGFSQWIECPIHPYDVGSGVTLVVSYDVPASSHYAYIVGAYCTGVAPQSWISCVESRYASTISTFPTNVDGATDVADIVLTH